MACSLRLQGFVDTRKPLRRHGENNPRCSFPLRFQSVSLDNLLNTDWVLDQQADRTEDVQNDDNCDENGGSDHRSLRLTELKCVYFLVRLGCRLC
jgi:hypothetical protein